MARESGDFVIKIAKDLKDVEAWEGGAGIKLPDGRYNGEIVRVSQKMEEGYQAPVVNVVAKILDGEFEGQETMADGLSLAETALGKFKSFMLAISSGKADHGTAFRSKDLVGRKYSFRVYPEEIKGQPGVMRNRFTDYQPYDANVKSVTSPAPGNSGSKGAAPVAQGAAAQAQTDITGF